jgi:hypothetical protein
MPHRRTIKKGSFGGNLDELLKHLDEDRSPEPRNQPDGAEPPAADKQSIHDKLFEKSWHAAREEAQRARFSNE